MFDPPVREGADTGRLRKMLTWSAQVLVEVGPDLIGTVLPGAGLVASLGAVVADRAGWTSQVLRLDQRKRSETATGPVEQGRIFEQYTQVLRELSGRRPLLLVVDDLHWADDASASLLFHLSRRIAGHRILVLAGYRPDEVAAAQESGRGAVAKVLAEIQRYAGDVTVDLGRITDPDARRAFLDDLPHHRRIAGLAPVG